MKNAYIFNAIQEISNKIQSFFTSDPYPLKNRLKKCYTKINPFLILDVGCGVGTCIISDYNYIGIDTNANYIDFCKKRRKGKFLLMNGSKLAFKEGIFDIVLMSSIGHHIPDESLIECLKEAKKVLKKEGRLIFADVVRPLVSMRWLSAFLEKCDEGASFRNKEEYLSMLARHFTLEKSDSYRDQGYNTAFFILKK